VEEDDISERAENWHRRRRRERWEREEDECYGGRKGRLWKVGFAEARRISATIGPARVGVLRGVRNGRTQDGVLFSPYDEDILENICSP
jgi:hypothetical protein